MRDGVPADRIAEYFPAVGADAASDALDFARYVDSYDSAPGRMMRLLLDADTAVQIIEPLRHVLLGHEVRAHLRVVVEGQERPRGSP